VLGALTHTGAVVSAERAPSVTSPLKRSRRVDRGVYRLYG
jgi:hypothetical protein